MSNIQRLEDRIISTADMKLEQRIDQQLKAIREQVRELPEYAFEANDSDQTAQRITVQLSPLELVDVLASALFAARAPHVRQRALSDFLTKVAAAGIEI